MTLGQLCHWGPLSALAIIKCITLATFQTATTCFTPFDTVSGVISYVFFTASVGLTLYHFFCAAIVGPGFIPLKWKPEDGENIPKLQWCSLCQGYKPPRAHHCRKCNRCVMKMDHHCPWINNCCGHGNHAHFVLFLLFAIIGSFQSTIYLGFGLYRVFNYRYYVFYMNKRSLLNFSLSYLVLSVFSLGLAIGVVIALGGLLYVQLKAILKNETNIESWIVIKARGRPRREGEPSFIYPYDLGRWRNFKYVFFASLNTDSKSSTNGFLWPIVDGCDQYTLTVEQLQQKRMKKAISQRYIIIKDYNGAIFPISEGMRVCCSPPCSDEPRIALQNGDSVLVTRWKRHWLYGERFISDRKLDGVEAKDNPKGWFPRLCAAEFETPLAEDKEISKKKL